MSGCLSPLEQEVMDMTYQAKQDLPNQSPCVSIRSSLPAPPHGGTVNPALSGHFG